MASEFDISNIPVEGQTPSVEDPGTSVLSPNYRSRDVFGGQQIGGTVGGILGSFLGPIGSAAGSALGGAAGEAVEQVSKDEPFSLSRVGSAGLEEALWDAGGNLVLKGLGKTLRFGTDALGFTSKDIPDANKAAQTFLEKQGSSLPLSARTGMGLDAALEGLINTPATYDIFKAKQQEIRNALESGQKNVIKQFVSSPEFEQALRSGSSAQAASGQVLQNFIKQGEQALSDSVDKTYKDLFASIPKENLLEVTTGGSPKISMFPLVTWANAQLANPTALTAGQRSILNEIKNLPPQVDFNTVHQMRSRWLAENRDKYSSLGTEKDSRAVGTISGLVKKLDESLDFSAERTLPKEALSKYREVTKTYREGIQGLQTEAIQTALTKNPEEVGAFLFASGNETPIKDLYKSVAAAGTLLKKDSSEVMNALRIGYLDALTHTPENMLKFAKDLEQNKAMKNTFNVLFGGTPQKEAIDAMNNAAKLGLVAPERQAGLNMATAGAMRGLAGQAALVGSGYYFLLSDEQKEKVKESGIPLALSAGGLLLSQRNLAKLMLDPQGARAIKYLSTAKEKLSSPTAFTKLVVEPMYQVLSTPFSPNAPSFGRTSEFDISNLPVK